MKILVTGGAGFIGSHIVDAFVHSGHRVVVVDDLSTGHANNVNPLAEFVQADIRSKEMDALFREEQFDIVNHQAARVNVRESFEDPVGYSEVNVLGSLNLLECSRRHAVKRFIYASSGGCVYGELQYAPADEQHPVRPRDPYGISKASLELYLPVFQLNYGLDYTVLRYPNVYGPRQDPSGEAGVIAIFTGQMLRGLPTVTNGGGENLRDYVYVDDIVGANVLALTKGTNQVYNLGWGKGISVNEIFRRLKALTDYPLEQRFGPAKAGEVRASYLDASKAARELGWRPLVDLGEGLRRTVEFFRPVFAEAT